MDWFQGVKSSSLLKTLVNELISMVFVRDRSLIHASFRQLKSIWLHFLANSNSTIEPSDLELMFLSLEFERLNLMSSHGKFESYVLSFLEIVII